MSNLEYLISLAGSADQPDWRASFLRVLRSTDVKEIYGNPQLNRVSFILSRARMRKDNSIKLGLETFGLESLISELEVLSGDDKLETYGVETGSHTGSCFVLDGKLIGCEFVKRGFSRTLSYNGE